jgi:DMSO/TMAO reductase YedYZ molybdopterin-dependent catalytic subunit
MKSTELVDNAAMPDLSRRQALQLAAAGAGALALGRPALARAGAPAIVKPLPPEWFIDYGTNAEMRWEAMQGQPYLVSNERFFVRNHTATPAIDMEAYRLALSGSGLRRGPVSFSLAELERMPARTISSAIECAGNGRSYFGSVQGTPISGTQWKLGAIGVARWRGVPLSEVLDRAGLSPHAVSVMPQGLDAEVVASGANQGHVRRPLPIAKALDDALLAYEMNGRDLPPDHGAPLRLVVPGWVGVASIKWVGSIEVSRTPQQSFWNTAQYRMVGPQYPADSPPLGVQPVKSAFELAPGATLPAGSRTTVTGRSWSGHAPIARVDVSTDGGRTWHRARPRGANREHTWQRWAFDWTPKHPGERALIARAADERGHVQPDAVPFNTGGYQFWATIRHPVHVAG